MGSNWPNSAARGSGARAYSWRVRPRIAWRPPACCGLTLLGLGLGWLGPVARGSGRAVYGCTGTRRGLWSVGWVFVDLVHLLSPPLRSTADRVQPGGSLSLPSPAPPLPRRRWAAPCSGGAPVPFSPLFFHPKWHLDFRSLCASRVASLFLSLPTVAIRGALHRGGGRPWRTHGRASPSVFPCSSLGKGARLERSRARQEH